MKIENGLVTYEGVMHNDQGDLVCSECSGTMMEHIKHVDALEWFANIYQCTCGNEITVTIRRDGMDDFIRQYYNKG